MKLPLRAAILSLVVLVPLQAQHILLTQVDGQVLPVQAVRSALPMVRIDGHLRPARGAAALMQKAPYFHDGSVLLADLKITIDEEAVAMGGGTGEAVNCSITLAGNLTASQELDDCYLTFVTPATPKHRGDLGIVEMPHLTPGKKIPFRKTLIVGSPPEDGQYSLNFFSGRGECVMVQDPVALAGHYPTATGYLAATAQGALRPIFIVPPKYPATLAARNLAGQVTVRCQVGTEGDVANATVLQASQPEFGGAALAAVRQWLFRPAVKNHQFVGTVVDIPVSFPAPGGSDPAKG